MPCQLDRLNWLDFQESSTKSDKPLSSNSFCFFLESSSSRPNLIWKQNNPSELARSSQLDNIERVSDSGLESRVPVSVLAQIGLYGRMSFQNVFTFQCDIEFKWTSSSGVVNWLWFGFSFHLYSLATLKPRVEVSVSEHEVWRYSKRFHSTVNISSPRNLNDVSLFLFWRSFKRRLEKK